VNEVLLDREVGESLATDAAMERLDPPTHTEVDLVEVWLVLGRLDGAEYRIVRAERLIAAIGREYRSWWLYPAAFESRQLAAAALAEILDPQSPMEAPALAAIMVEEAVAVVIARMQPDQQESCAAAIAFLVDKILLPFAETTSYDAFQAVDAEEGKPWSGEDFDFAIDLLQTLQELLEVRDGQQVILIGCEPGADSGGDHGAGGSGGDG
jgi:hypothetical protein